MKPERETLVCRRNISTKSPQNCRSLGCARDDKKGRVYAREEWLLKEKAVVEEKCLSPENNFSLNNQLLSFQTYPLTNTLSFSNHSLPVI
jgi:hypothetical protein